ncbi:L,D-transpeptidase family protein [Natronospora cellulosivora (SeqCode)]
MKKKILGFLIFTLFLMLQLVFISNNTYAYFDLEGMYNALDNYQQIAADGGWPTIPDGSNLKLGDYSERVLILRERLEITGELDDCNLIEELKMFDEAIDKAVRRFQKSHGLLVDGIVGRNTLRELNISVENRIKEIQYNISEMEKYHELSGMKYIIVNIPDFHMNLVDNEEIIKQMKVIVGRQGHKTPVFNDEIKYLVFNPSWFIPFNTSIRDFIPSIRQDPNYFSSRDIRVFRISDGREVNTQSINWSLINRQNFVYRLEQAPGPKNPMGQVKFIFPNIYHVYLHGTPDSHLFNNYIRTYSLGCVRLEEPIELAKILLKDYSIYTDTEIDEIIEKGITKTVYLEEPLAIYIVYWTVWVDDKGEVNFRRDIYNRF